LGGVPAIDGQGDPDDEPGVGTAEPQYGGGDLLRSAEPVDGLVGDGLGQVQLTLGDHVGDHRGLDGAGAHRVDPDAAGCVLQRCASGQAEDAVLGRMVGGPPGEPDQATGGKSSSRSHRCLESASARARASCTPTHR